MNLVVDAPFVEMMDDLCALDEKNGHPQAPEANRAQALAGLDRILVDRLTRHEHIRYLQKRLGQPFRHQTALSEEQEEQVVSHGPGVLANDELAVLLLNPIALGDLAFLIAAALPDYWLERMSEVGRQVMQESGIVRKPRGLADF